MSDPASKTLEAAAPELLAALKDVFALIEEGALVRNTENDASPEFHSSALRFTLRLSKAHQAIAKAEGK